MDDGNRVLWDAGRHGDYDCLERERPDTNYDYVELRPDPIAACKGRHSTCARGVYRPMILVFGDRDFPQCRQNHH